MTGLDAAKAKVMRFQEAAVNNAKAVVAGLADGDGDYSAVRVMEDNIKTIVYDEYDPVLYERKGEFGGLGGAVTADVDGLEVRVYIDGNKLIDSTGTTVGGLMDDGTPYFWRVIKGDSNYNYDFPKSGAAFMKPRDFFTPTVEAMEQEFSSGSFRQQLIAAINAAKTV